jgi:hypothetical protein
MQIEKDDDVSGRLLNINQISPNRPSSSFVSPYIAPSEANDIISAHSNSKTSKAAASSHAPSPPLNEFQSPANTDDVCTCTKNPNSLFNTYSSPGDRFWHFGQWIQKGDSVLVIDASSGRYAAKYMTATETEVRHMVWVYIDQDSK